MINLITVKKMTLALGIGLFSHSLLASTSYNCLKSLTAQIEFVTSPQHPTNFFFSKVNANQFLLIQENKSYLCKTDAPLAYDSTIEIMTNLAGLSASRKLFYSKTPLSKEKPQTNSPTIPVINGYLPPHEPRDTTMEVSTASLATKKNFASCELTQNEKLVASHLTSLAEVEIKDLYADFAENRDAIAYSWGVKDSEKQKMRTAFDYKLKQILEVCSSVPELKSVSQQIATKLQPHTAVKLTVSATSTPSTKTKVKLPVGAQQ